MPIGFAFAGPVSERIGIPETLYAAAAIMAVPCALIVLVPGVRNVRRTDEGLVVLQAGV